jgi:DNA-binding response OmpR family regulator
MTRVLIVEDEETLAQKLSDKMRSEGFVVTTASNGEQGLDFIRKRKSRN